MFPLSRDQLMKSDKITGWRWLRGWLALEEVQLEAAFARLHRAEGAHVEVAVLEGGAAADGREGGRLGVTEHVERVGFLGSGLRRKESGLLGECLVLRRGVGLEEYLYSAEVVSLRRHFDLAGLELRCAEVELGGRDVGNWFRLGECEVVGVGEVGGVEHVSHGVEIIGSWHWFLRKLELWLVEL